MFTFQTEFESGMGENILPCLIKNKNDIDMDLQCATAIEHWQLVSEFIEISQNKICGGECDSCKFELNKNTLLFSIDVIGSYFRPSYCVDGKKIKVII